MNPVLPWRLCWLCLVLSMMGTSELWAFESTKVLPRGRFNLSVRGLYGTMDQRYSSSGGTATESLATPLSRSLSMRDILQREQPIKARKLEGFMLENGMDPEASLGRYDASMTVSVQAVAPVLAYGVTDSLTLALVIPYIRTRSNVSMGFTPDKGGAALVQRLEDVSVNQRLAAEEARLRLSQGSQELTRAMAEDGYRPLGTETSEGLGDVMMVARWRVPVNAGLSVAPHVMVTAPTGKVDDPDRLTDIPRGDGQWDVGTNLVVDQQLLPWLLLNGYSGYLWQLPGRKTVRLATEREPIVAEKANVPFDLGDVFEAGTSLQTESSYGLTSGLGLVYRRKFADRYRHVSREVESELSKQTDMESYAWEAAIGYSTVPAFMQRRFVAPLNATVAYRQLMRGRNAYRMNLWQWEMNAFF